MTLGEKKEEFDIRDVTIAPGTTITGLYGHYVRCSSVLPTATLMLTRYRTRNGAF